MGYAESAVEGLGCRRLVDRFLFRSAVVELVTDIGRGWR